MRCAYAIALPPRGKEVSVISFFSVSTSSASFAGLSQRMRWKRGKRKARPDLWRVDSCTLSNSNSATSAGDSTRTGPEALDRVVAHPAVELLQFLVGEAGIGLAHRHQLAAGCAGVVHHRAPAAEGEIGIEGRALAVAALGIHQHRVDDEGVALPLEPVALDAAGDVGALPALQHQALDAAGARIGAQSAQARSSRRTGSAARGRSVAAIARRTRLPGAAAARARAAGAGPRCR